MQYWMDGLEEWHLSTNGEDLGLADGLTYRRPLPILANHPEAIPLEPGEVLQVGDRGLTRDGRDTGELAEMCGCNKDTHPLWSDSVSGYYMTSGKWYLSGGPGHKNDIIARLPKVAKEAEKAKEEKKMENTNLIDIGSVHYADFHGTPANFRIPIIEAARIAQLPEVQAEVKRQEEAKRIGPGDWAFDKIRQCVFEVKKVGRHQVVGIEMAFSDDACEEAHELSECRKLNLPPEVIAALNAEIDAKAGG